MLKGNIEEIFEKYEDEFNKTEDDVLYLVRCGVMYSRWNNFTMFV